MSRIHMHMVVANLDHSTLYYTALFGAEPTVVKTDYVKWVLDDPCLNFDISTRGRVPGLDHVGIQTDTAGGLDALQARMEAAGFAGQPQQDTACCYEHSHKFWLLDPEGTAWEAFHSLYPIDTFNEGESAKATGGCCAPFQSEQDSCKN